MNLQITEPLTYPYVALNELKNHKMLVKKHQYYDFLITKFMKISESYNDLILTMIN